VPVSGDIILPSQMRGGQTLEDMGLILEGLCLPASLIWDSHFSQPWDWNCESEVSIVQCPDPGLKTATASLLTTVSING